MSVKRADFPLWLVVMLGGIGVMVLGGIFSPIYAEIYPLLARGIWVTVWVSAVSFAAACLLGAGLALGSLSRHYLIRQFVRLYVEVMRGLPIMVVLLYVAFVGVPLGVEGWNALGLPPLVTRDVPLIGRAVLALVLAYAAFLAEVFRAGLLSVPRGQIEAAKALGFTRMQRLRRIIIPQAFRAILPPLGNDFIAMVKDSSLVSVLGVAEITQMAKLAAASNFRYMETYSATAAIYLGLTLLLSLGLRRLESILRRGFDIGQGRRASDRL